MRVAIFGGTFDPVHSAHLEIAREALDYFHLDQVLFVPAAHPPHKSAHKHTPYEHRYKMVELACSGEPRFQPSRVEEGNERSYSIHTIERLKSQRPQDDWCFLIGSDAFADIRTWYRWEDVVRAIHFLVVSRPGHNYYAPPGAHVSRLDNALRISSSELRRTLAKGESPREIPGAVLEYIRENRLYR